MRFQKLKRFSCFVFYSIFKTKMVKKLASKNNKIELGLLENSSFKALLNSKYQFSKKIVIVDENTQELCWPFLLTTFEELKEAEVIVLPTGEENKVMEVCFQVWEAFTNYQVQRNDLVINLGGGVVTDMGGFIASVFKRGVDFINIPTTLLAMVDASVGGKTGINLDVHKNQLGVFSNPELTICDASFLATLPEKEMISGKAEIIKHALINSRSFFDELTQHLEGVPNDEILAKAIQIKADIVDQDFREQGERKKLNFGHTIGHSIEGLLLHNKIEVTHGECVAWGMLVEAYISHEVATLPKNELQEIEQLIRGQYETLAINDTIFDSLIQLMKHDKKNNSDKINFTLLQKIGLAKINYQLEEDVILRALNHVFGQ